MRKRSKKQLEFGHLDGRMAVITDDNGVLCAVVKRGRKARLAPMSHLSDEYPDIWDSPSVIDDPRVRKALGLSEEAPPLDLVESSRPSGYDGPPPAGLTEYLNGL